MASHEKTRLSETFELLMDPHRRYVLYHLTEESDAATVETLATAIARWSGDHAAAGRSDDRRGIEINLRHRHLPKLADAGVVAFDANSGTVELRDLNGQGRFVEEAARVDGYGRADDD